MRMTLLLFTVFCCSAAIVLAGPNVGGTITLHWSSAIVYSLDDPAWQDPGLTECESSVTQAPAATSLPNPPWEERQIWFVYAAFPYESSPRLKAVAFGVNYAAFSTPDGIKIDWQSPPPGATEIITTIPAWPLPNSGTSIVFATTLTAWMNEIYMFAGYGSAGQIFSLRTHPTHASQFADDSVPARQDAIAGYGTLGFGVDGQRACPPSVGACCYPDGTCHRVTQGICNGAGGVYQGDDALCDPSPCPPAGACCSPDGTCRFVMEQLCSTGDWRLDVTCNPNPCPPPSGACCFSDGSCRFLNGADCAGAGGIWHGFGSTCDPNPCPQPGACCYPNGACVFTLPSQCSTGDFRPGVSCDPNPCPQPGACCFVNGSCRFVLQNLCPTGDWRADLPCVPNPCPQIEGACCFPDGSCLFLSGTLCEDQGGDWLGQDTNCAPNPCPQPGACCGADGSCTFVLPSQCSTGDFRPGVSCDPNPCPPAGACCHTNGTCTIRTEIHCASPDIWLGPGTTCIPNLCPQPSGACCYADSHCEFVPEAECATGDWRRDVPCTPNPCAALGACCFVDGHCEYLIHLACPTADWRLGVTCTPNPCPPPQDPCAQTPRRQGGPGPHPGVAINWDLANHAQPVDKATYVGDGLGDGREGGEDFGSAMVIGSLPFYDTGATCDNADNITLPCAASAAPDVVYSYTAFTYGQINVSLCGSGYDCALGIYSSSPICLCCNDDFCGLQSEIDNFAVVAGQTYYIVVDGFSTNCGSYVISLTENTPPPPLECPAGAQLEGEPDCYDGYYDVYNGGCQTTSWTSICPQDGGHAVLCGKSGTYLYRGYSYRDTDWFICNAIGGEACATWTGTFPILGFMMYNHPRCPVGSADSITGNPLQPVTLCRNFTVGEEFWLWAGPSVFTGVPCGSDYILEVTGIRCGTPTTGACCIGGVCQVLTEADCLAQGGNFVGGPCEPSPCVVPTETKSWGRIKYLYK